MASFYLRVRNQLASKNRGGGHADYIAGEGYYKNKNEVAGVIDKNLPAFASNFKEFLEAADKNERANGRSYRSLIIAIPKEANDKMAWACEYADKLLGEAHAYRLAFHNDEGNPHLHLTFSERPNTLDSLKFEPWKYFSRQNPKDRAISDRKWLAQAKELYLDHIKTVCPDFSPSKNSGEVKIGPKLAGAGEQYETGRAEREAQVNELRQLKAEFKDLDLQIKINQKSQMTDAVRPPTPSQGVKAGGGGFDAAGFIQSIKEDGYFISHLKALAKMNGAFAGLADCAQSLKRMKLTSQKMEAIDNHYKKVSKEAIGKTNHQEGDWFVNAQAYKLKAMAAFLNPPAPKPLPNPENQSLPLENKRKLPTPKPPWMI
jgi:MobA/MobL family